MGGLDGIRVVELATWAAAPCAGVMLADWGADVIHVEHPGRGDPLRGYLSLGADGQVPDCDVNYLWELTNRNKRSVTLDLSKPQGREVMRQLIVRADVFSSNLRPYELEKFGLDYEALRVVHPKLVFANVTGFGPKGAQANKPAFDFAAFWSRSGIMQTLADPDSPPPGGRPGVGDHITSLALALAILAALLIRERTGVGQAVNVSLLHTGLWTLGWDVQSVLATGHEVHKQSRAERRNPLVSYYQTKDQRWIALVLTPPDVYWSQFCRAVEREDLERDPRFDSYDSRFAHHRELTAILDGLFALRTKDEWQQRLDMFDLNWSPVQTLEEVVHDPQATANGYFVPFDHPNHGQVSLLATPVQFSDTPATIRSKAPEAGEHNEEVLLELGYDWDAIVALKQKGVIS